MLNDLIEAAKSKLLDKVVVRKPRRRVKAQPAPGFYGVPTYSERYAPKRKAK